MSLSIGELVGYVRLDTDGVKSGLATAGSDIKRATGSWSGSMSQGGMAGGSAYGSSFTKSTKSKLGGVLTSIKGLVGPLAALGAGAAIGGFLKGAFDEAQEAQKVGAQTAAVLKSTGHAAGETQTDIENLAGSISAKIGVDDEAIQSGENLLLTFKGIRNEAGKGNDIFDQTTGLMTDMSAAMGQDMKSSAIMLGKALNDPAKGMTALTRVGVTFTQQQQDQVKKLMATGHTMEAQKIILGELKSEFGGSAEAMATPADKASVAWGNFKEMVGTQLMPIVNSALTWFTTKLVPGLSQVSSWIDHMGDSGTQTGAKFQQFQQLAMQVWDAVSKVVRDNIGTVKDIIREGTALAQLIWQKFGANIIAYVRSAWTLISGVIRGALLVIRGVIRIVTGLIRGDWSQVWAGIKDILRGAWIAIRAIVVGALGMLKAVMSAAWTQIKTIVSSAWSGIKTKVSEGATALVGYIKAIPGRIRSAAGSLFSNAGHWLIQQFIDGMKNAAGIISGIAGNVWDAVRSMLNGAIDRINSALDFTISIPGPDIHVNAGQIPHLATGGRATRGTLAVIGEGREPETVLPDSVLHGLLKRAHDAGASLARKGDDGGRGAPLIGQVVQAPGESTDQLAEKLWHNLRRPY